MIFRYFENIKTAAQRRRMGRYGRDEIYGPICGAIVADAVFQGAGNYTFDFRRAIGPIPDDWRASWQGAKDELRLQRDDAADKVSGRTLVAPSTMARPAGYSFEVVDKFFR